MPEEKEYNNTFIQNILFFQVERYRARIQICKGNITVSSLNLIEKVDHDDDAYDPITFILIQKNGKELHNNNKWIAVYLKINARNLARWHGFCFTGWEFNYIYVATLPKSTENY